MLQQKLNRTPSLLSGQSDIWVPVQQYNRSVWRLRREVPAAAVTTHAKPHALKQLARDVEVDRAAMAQRCRPQSSGSGLVCAGTYTKLSFSFSVC